MLIIFDSGIGGFECAYKLTRGQATNNPTTQILYYADTKNFPYGNKTRQELIAIISKAFELFNTLGATKVIVACNTASAIIQDLCERNLNNFNKNKTYNAIEILDMMTALNHILSTQQDLTLLATQLTAQYLSAQTTHKIIALPMLASLIEFNQTDNIESYLLENIPLATKKIVYACTHYPLAHNIFSSLFDCQYFNPIDHIIKQVQTVNTSYMLNFYDKEIEEKYYKITHSLQLQTK